MCGIVGFLKKRAESEEPMGATLLKMLQALACRGPDGSGVAILRSDLGEATEQWVIRVAGADGKPNANLGALGTVSGLEIAAGDTVRFRFAPNPGVQPEDVEHALGARRGGLEVLSLGRSIDLVKQVGSPDELEAAYGISAWRGSIAVGHTRMSTESRIDLSHSQPFWIHGVADLATVHNGHITNYHQLRRKYEQEGVTFYTDNDSEVIGVYLRDRINHGRTLAEALADSIDDLDGAYTYIVASPEGLGVVRDRYGFKPLMTAETDDWVVFATEEIAIRRALTGNFRVAEPKPGLAAFYESEQLIGV